MSQLTATPPGLGTEVVVGHSHADDAAVVRTAPGSPKLVLTADVIAPLVDDAATFGRIAAANALSDVYAMGGVPHFALNLCFFPSDRLPNEVLIDVLNGAADLCRQANVAIVGGHSVVNPDLKYGLAVTGTVVAAPWSNRNGNIGQHLVLTKALGTGIVGTAIKNGESETAWTAAAIASMTQLNRHASELGHRFGATACTDVTGFGLLGHLHNIAAGSECAAELDLTQFPVLPGTHECIRMGNVPGGTRANLKSALGFVHNIERVDPELALVAADAQTSGGLLLTVDAERSDDLVGALRASDHAATKVGQLIVASGLVKPGDIVLR